MPLRVSLSLSLLIGVCNVAMPLHVPLRHLHREGDFAACLHSGYLSALRLGYHLRVVNEKTRALTEPSEELKAAIVLNRSEHTDRLLDYSRLDRYMCATICLDILVSI